MKCQNLAFNAQSLRLIIVVARVRALKIYPGVVEALSGKGTEMMKLSLPPKLMLFSVSTPFEC
jgi:hypothetical protein